MRGRSVLGAATNATPALAGGRAFFRAGDRLLCLPLEPSAGDPADAAGGR